MINTIVVVVVGLLGPSYCLAPPKLSVPSSANNCSSRRDYLQIPIFTAMLVEGILVDNVAEAVGEEGGTVLEAEGDECRDGAIVSEVSIPGAYQQACMTLPKRSVPLQSTKDYLTIRQGGSVGAGQTGVAVWNSALLLTRLLDTLTLKDPSWLSKTPTTVLELGCGTGLASIAAAKCGAARVIATDGNPNVLHLARENVRLNHVEGQVRVELLQWGFLGASDYAEEADLMIGSDLLYNPGMWKVLAETISTVLKPGGIAIYLSLGHTGFNVNAEVNGFLSVIQSEGIKIVQDGSTTSSPLPVSSVSDALAECVSSKERSVLNESGGCRVVVLRQG